MQWNPGEPFDRLRTGFGHARQTPDFAALHPGYITSIFLFQPALSPQQDCGEYKLKVKQSVGRAVPDNLIRRA